jgi:hypothetical protein
MRERQVSVMKRPSQAEPNRREMKQIGTTTPADSGDSCRLRLALE